jgi:hypothetical protein
MRRGAIKAWLAYAAAGLLATALVAFVVIALSPAQYTRAIVTAAVVAYALQLAAFAALLAVREKNHLFLAGWLGGMLLRFGVVGAMLYWSTRSATLPVMPLVLSLVGFVFMLLLLEPVFLRWDLRKS